MHEAAHVPLLQVSPELHVEHSPPPVPHAEVELPVWHTFPAQHPVGHVVELQMNAHRPPTHESEPVQVLHVEPLTPHAASEVPGRQTPFAQQPEGQVVGLQVLPPLQVPALQV